MTLPPWCLRLIVLVEARAAPRLQTVEGLWRKGHPHGVVVFRNCSGVERRIGEMACYACLQFFFSDDATLSQKVSYSVLTWCVALYSCIAVFAPALVPTSTPQRAGTPTLILTRTTSRRIRASWCAMRCSAG